MKFIIVPYVMVNGSWTITDFMMEDVYWKMIDQGLADEIFYDGTIDEVSKFVNHMKKPLNSVVTSWYEAEGGTPIAALGWLNHFGENHAMVHFCTFNEIAPRQKIELGKQVLAYWLNMKRPDKTPLFDVLIGLTPERYETVLKYIRMLGWKQLGTIPNLIIHQKYGKIGGVISYLERGDL